MRASVKKFGSLDELISFEKNVKYENASDVNLDSYSISADVKSRLDRLKGAKFVGIYGGEIVSAVSDQFSVINVERISDACNKAFGDNYTEKSVREGIVRIYNVGVEDVTGKVTPLVVYPANLGTMAVRIGLYHNAFVCSNGMILADGALSQKVIHRSVDVDLTLKTNLIREGLEDVLNRVKAAETINVDPGLQLALIVQGLDKKDALVKKALGKYHPEGNTLWNTIQAITYVSTHETKEGFDYARNAGVFLSKPELSPADLVDAASYVFCKEQKGAMSFEHSKELYSLARKVLA